VPDATLIVRRASVSRKGGSWDDNDFDVFDVGRIYRVDSNDGIEVWFWGLSAAFQLTARKCYGRTRSLDDAKAAFRVEYEAWQKDAANGQDNH
jgi:hypothetical protein